MIAGYLEEHLGFSKENAIDLAWVEFGFAHSPLHGFECVCIDSLLRFVCCMTFCRGRGGTYRPMVFASDGTVCNVWCSFQKRTWLNANNKIDFDIGFQLLRITSRKHICGFVFLSSCTRLHEAFFWSDLCCTMLGIYARDICCVLSRCWIRFMGFNCMP